MKPRQISHESYTAEQLKILESVLEIKQSGKEKMRMYISDPK